MADKKYRIKVACPQCGCTELTTLSEEEIKEKYGDDPRFHMECGECQLQYETAREEACPEWDKECKLKE
jgi:hypothetical protein